jgi:hypothetical protein
VVFGMWVWWIVGFFLSCDTEYSLTGRKDNA